MDDLSSCQVAHTAGDLDSHVNKILLGDGLHRENDGNIIKREITTFRIDIHLYTQYLYQIFGLILHSLSSQPSKTQVLPLLYSVLLDQVSYNLHKAKWRD